jgi:transketolase
MSAIEIVRRPHAHSFVRWAADRPEVLVLSADLTASCEADAFRDAYPDRFLSMGMAEQCMISAAGGLAREGFSPWVHTFAVFICRRAFDQVAMSVAYPNLPVRLLGFLPGITTPGGVTHQAIDDLALMRVLPNLTVVECGDATEVESLPGAIADIPGPVYARVLRGDVPRLFPADAPMKVGEVRLLSRGDDVAVLSSGICTETSVQAVSLLRARGVGVTLVHVHTLKPFGDPRVLDLLSQVRLGVVTLENHSVIGGLGSVLAETMAEQGLRSRLVRLGLQDRYAHGASRGYLARELGIDALALVRAVEGFTGDLGIDPGDVAPAVPSAATEAPSSGSPGPAKAEAL